MKTILAQAVLLALCSPAFAHDLAPQTLDNVQVTSFKEPVSVGEGTHSVSVVSGEDLRARGATDLRSALSLVSGVDVAPGGDGGPAASVPAMRGLREFDAFLLLVDGVPAGGAFTPALSTLSMVNVERIEVLKGAAPVSYGATSFVGVIHVIHYAAGEGPREVEVGVGSHASARFALSLPLTTEGPWKQSLLFDAERQQVSGADRTAWRRGHAFYRGAGEVFGGQFSLDVELTKVGQDPASPHVREGRFLTTRTPIGANHNPGDATIDESRTQVSMSYARDTAMGQWDTRLAVAHNDGNIVRGFLRGGFATNGTTINADGYYQDRSTDEVYFDTHFNSEINDKARVIWGTDYMRGNGSQHSRRFEYAVRGDGANAPYSRSRPVLQRTYLSDVRNFHGLYADLLLTPSDRWHVDAGLRYNYTDETRRTRIDAGAIREDSRSEGRWSGALGSSFRFWGDDKTYITGYGSVRRTFKPAVVDFGPGAERDVLKPETADSYEIGVRGAMLDSRLEWDLSAFRMDFENQVVTQNVNNVPSLVNAGSTRFDGAEFEADWRILDDLTLTGTYAWHDARFQDYQQLFGSTLTQLRGKVMEMSPGHTASLGLVYAPEHGFTAYAVQSYADARYLNKRNTAPVPAYRTVDAGIGYRAERWELRLDGTNLTDHRDAVAESELGDAQYYLLPGRAAWLTYRTRF